jgi:hypothetical protein
MKIAHPKTNIRRTFLEKQCFDFMADIVSIELGFRQQVAAEALKNVAKRAKRIFLGSAIRAAESPQGNLIGRESPENRYVKCEAIDARTLVRTQATHLCLDSQFNLPGLIIPIGINIRDAPGRKASRRDVGDLRFHNESCRSCSNELSVSEFGPDQYTEGFFCYIQTSPLRLYN